MKCVFCFCSAPGVVQTLEVVDVTSSSISVQWGAPVTFNGYVYPLPYSAEITDMDTLAATVVQSSSLSHTFSSLVAYRNYSISVFARSSGGNGTSTTVSQRTSASGK